MQRSDSSSTPPSSDGKFEDDSDISDGPYSMLIEKAIWSSDSGYMSLQEIYDWFRNNTGKAVEGSNNTRGWMNSIRHNLSLNDVCECLATLFVLGD